MLSPRVLLASAALLAPVTSLAAPLLGRPKLKDSILQLDIPVAF